MSADPKTPSTAGWESPTATAEPASPAGGGSSDLLAEHPEALAGAAFVGGLLTALIVRRLGR